MGEQALAEAGDDPERRARVLGRLGYLAMQLDLERGVGLVDDGVRILEAAADHQAIDPDTLANVLLLRANAELALVRPTRPGDVDRGIGLISTGGRSWEKEGAEGCAFGLLRMTDDLDRAIAMTRETIRVKSGPGGDDPFNVVQLSGLLLFRGQWTEARREAEAAAEEYQREGAEIHPAWALRGLALVAAHDGRLDDARRWAEQGLAQATERGDAVLAIFHHHILGFVALTNEAWPEADAHLTAAAALADGIAVRHPGRFKLAGDQVEAALALGDVARAQAVVERLDEAARIAPTPWVLAVGARCAALVDGARDDSEAAIAHVDRALRLHDDLPMPFERARTLLAKGRLHRRRKEKRLADETLREALAIFESLGAPDWARRTRRRAGPGRAAAARPGLAHRHGAAGRRARRDRPLQPRGRGARVHGPQDRGQRPRAGVREARDPLAGRARGGDGVGVREPPLIGAIAPYLGTRRANTVHRMDRPAVVDPQSPATFLVERYWPGIDLGRLRAMLPRLDAAARTMTAEGTPVEHIGSILMPVDEVVFSLITAADEGVVRRVNERAGLPVDRIAAAIALLTPATSTR